jgi:UDPglucose 6-dehydrogenase
LGLSDTKDLAVIATLNAVYISFSEKNIPILYTDWQTAELIKYAANSFLATKITFINEMSRLADRV